MSYLQILERQISLGMCLEDCQSSGSSFLAGSDCSFDASCCEAVDFCMNEWGQLL